MLSEGQFHKQVPKELDWNCHFRRFVTNECLRDPKIRQAVAAYCAQDILFFINTFLWQYNPKSIGDGSLETGPFITWDFQESALMSQDEDAPGMLWCIEHQKDLIIVKSRDMGASWLCLIVILWIFMFHKRKKILVISRNQEAVDRPGDSDSLFWKLDFAIRYLPTWMSKSVDRRKLGFSHENGSIITGQATTSKSGVGGRAYLMFIDEFSQIDEDYDVLHRTSDTTSCRIFNGTHLGTSTAFFELSDPMSAAGSYIKRLYMHWTQHPDKRRGLYRFNPVRREIELLDPTYPHRHDYAFERDGSPTGGFLPGVRSPWYDEQVRRKGNSRAVAMDLDIDPRGAIDQFFNALTIHYLKREFCIPPVFDGDLEYDRDTGKPTRFRARSNGPIRMWISPTYDDQVPYGTFGFGADVAAGKGATPTCISGLNLKTGEKVIEFTDPWISPDECAVLAVALCRMFRTENGEPAMLIWELVGPGLVWGDIVLGLGHTNVYYRQNELASNVVRTFGSTETPGWMPTLTNKRLVLEDYRRALEKKEFINRSEAALDECLMFKYGTKGQVVHDREESTDGSGSRDNHGDHVMADALANKLAKGTLSGMLRKEKEISRSCIAWRRQLRQNARKDEVIWA